MYTPRSFKNDDSETLHAMIRAYNFGLLVSHDDAGPTATHLPFMIDSARGENGTLIAHMARANPHWKAWTEDTVLLAVFQGPHTYISPAWYVEQETVPTWNYAAVHAYGRPQLIHDTDRLKDMVVALVDIQEAQIGRPWDTAKMEGSMETDLKAIVGIEMPIDRLEGKYKFNQNRSVDDQASVVQALGGADDPMQRAVADIMKNNLDRAR